MANLWTPHVVFLSEEKEPRYLLVTFVMPSLTELVYYQTNSVWKLSHGRLAMIGTQCDKPRSVAPMLNL